MAKWKVRVVLKGPQASADTRDRIVIDASDWADVEADTESQARALARLLWGAARLPLSADTTAPDELLTGGGVDFEVELVG